MSSSTVQLRPWLTVAGLIAVTLALPAPVRAIPVGGGDEPPPNICQISGQSLTASRPAVEQGKPVTIRWQVTLGLYCGAAVVRLNSQTISPTGSKVIRPESSTVYEFTVFANFRTYILGSVAIQVYQRNNDLLTQLTGDGQTRLSRIRDLKLGTNQLPPLGEPEDRFLAIGDFDGDRHDDVLWMSPANEVVMWRMRNGFRLAVGFLGAVPDGTAFQGVADFNGNGVSDILWLAPVGLLRVWMDGSGSNFQAIDEVPGVPSQPDPSWKVVGVGDFNGDGMSDILSRHAMGTVAIHYLNGTVRIGEGHADGPDPVEFSGVVTIADLDRDGADDILWQQSDSAGPLVWFKGSVQGAAYILAHPVPGRVLAAAADFTLDGKADILWRYPDGDFQLWKLDGTAIVGETFIHAIDNRWAFAGIMGTAA